MKVLEPEDPGVLDLGNALGWPGCLKMSVCDIISAYNNYSQIINRIC